ncbi:DUF3073 domain-containing protein [Ornithinimicrobium avium]|uniref:DUF3073 domain-containing protein n=1 Tax=Ornithinimicrobium avium TaxID=2283195 RepID=A0A345NMK4_9MICO|nr:DUF3073 domain-containing protein [Ornithinimicrobium avium]AXH96262.1 DUF3073 domain-containing protein [Ornithinimicrobium avium]
MGRGRAKAKQIKVARKLKYSAPDTDLTALERELRGEHGDHSYDSSPTHDDGGDDEDDPYADYSAYGAEDEDEGSWHSRGHG